MMMMMMMLLIIIIIIIIITKGFPVTVRDNNFNLIEG
jgi:hypothetical protein